MRYKIQKKQKVEESVEYQQFNDITNSNANVVISHIENFVERKTRKEYNRKLIDKLLRIRQKKSQRNQPSFLDMPSLWTDQNQAKLLKIQKIGDEQAIREQMQEEVFSLDEPSEEVSIDPSTFLIMNNTNLNQQLSQCQTPKPKNEREKFNSEQAT